MKPAPLFSFWSKVQQRGSCWIWVGEKSRGYGRAWVLGKRVMAHRFSYRMWVGPIPSWLELDHLCRIHACVNPRHLEAVTKSINSLRGLGYNRRKTHCPQGHPYSLVNTYIQPKRGSRFCRECNRIYMVAYRQRKREKSIA